MNIHYLKLQTEYFDAVLKGVPEGYVVMGIKKVKK